jgi:hypothetical protein
MLYLPAPKRSFTLAQRITVDRQMDQRPAGHLRSGNFRVAERHGQDAIEMAVFTDKYGHNRIILVE